MSASFCNGLLKAILNNDEKRLIGASSPMLARIGGQQVPQSEADFCKQNKTGRSSASESRRKSLTHSMNDTYMDNIHVK